MWSNLQLFYYRFVMEPSLFTQHPDTMLGRMFSGVDYVQVCGNFFDQLLFIYYIFRWMKKESMRLQLVIPPRHSVLFWIIIELVLLIALLIAPFKSSEKHVTILCYPSSKSWQLQEFRYDYHDFFRPDRLTLSGLDG